MSKNELPPPLPPETRTVGQLVAETVKLYGDNLWPSLALGISVTVINQISVGHDTPFQVLVLAAGSPLMAASYTGASAIVGGVRPRRGDVVRAIVVGSIVFVPGGLSDAPLRAPGRGVARLRRPRRAGDRDRAPGDRGCLPSRDPAGPRRLRPCARVARDARDPLRAREADASCSSSATSATRANVWPSGSATSFSRRSSFSAAALLYVDQAARVRSRPAT